ncbi:hypothetical_protein [Leishmania major strain Friedlin]|nr:hypothetical_protein [Leishmania major strain Friedlin]
MYSPELEWLLGSATPVQQRRELKVSPATGCSVPASDSLHRATKLDSTVVDGHAMSSRPPTAPSAQRSTCTPGFYNSVQVIGGLPQRGPRAAADTFSAMPCRFL